MHHFIGKIIFNFFFGPKKCKCSSCSKLTKSVAGISLFATGLLFSQDCNLTLKGKVVDLHDNTPLISQEAQMCGVPIVLFDHNGMSEIVDHKVNG